MEYECRVCWNSNLHRLAYLEYEYLICVTNIEHNEHDKDQHVNPFIISKTYLGSPNSINEACPQDFHYLHNNTPNARIVKLKRSVSNMSVR